MIERGRPKVWNEWFRFASDELEFGDQESTEYANLRAVEDENRDLLRARAALDDPRSPRAV